ncbi:MAG: PepSY domain-containing protein [Steroidobacteraceae bacterium]|nr:PepSY domain-containing protein [Steroidobacteraceae bacterium]
MFKLPRHETKTLLAIHGWSGVLLGLLLYAVICTGVAAVFASELNDWASPLPHATVSADLPPGLDDAIRRLANEVDPQFHEEVAVYRGAGGRLNLLFHRHENGPDGRPTERGVEFELDPVSFAPLDRREGWLEEIEAQRASTGVADFLVNLHVRLHIPDPWGLFVTGVLGLAMMVAAVTGLVIHRHLLRDLFTMRLGRDAVLRRRDVHVVAGSWNLPFAFILAFTGSFFSFATSVGLPALAMVKFGGDQQALFETLSGAPRAEDPRPARLTNVDAILADARSRSNAEPNFLSITHYGRADSMATVYTELPADELVYSSYVYDGPTGTFIREAPPMGTRPSVGASLVGLMYPLHFGNFGGALSKAVWVGLGFTGAYVTLTGMLLWAKRREEQPAWRRMARFIHYVGYGLPLALVCAPYAFFILRDSDIPAATSQGVAFLTVAALTAVAAVTTRDMDRLRRRLLAATGIALLGLPVVRLATGGLGWMQALEHGIAAVPCVDAALMIVGVASLWVALGRRVRMALPTRVEGQIKSEPQAT